ncbi:MAG: response regulator [Myxococcales bacterium]|nr:response regulator [Myxococcales bacterium]
MATQLRDKQPATILVVDRDPRVRARLVALLEERWVVREAETAAASRSLLEARRVGVLIAGTRLEDGLGIELLEWAADEVYEAARIGYAAEPSADEVLELVNRGRVAAVFTARTGDKQLVALVERLLKRRALASVEITDPFVRAHRLETLGAVAGGIAHDFNNLLTVVLNCTSRLEDRVAHDPDLAGPVATIRDAVTRAGTLTEKLVAFARARETRATQVQVNDTIREVVGLLSPSLRREVVVELGLDDDLPTIQAIVGEIHQCVLNLCLNALEAMGDRGRLTVRSSRVIRPAGPDRSRMVPGTYVQIRVSDSGGGMTPEVRARAFDPFYSTKRRHGGATVGLGLAVARRIVERLDGSIDLVTQPGRGTTVTVLLPSGASAGASAPAVEVAPTIIMADDEPAIRRVGVRILEREGYRVIPVEDGARAIAAIREREDVVLVILDLVMPVMGGEEAYTAIRAENPNTRFLLCTGHAVTEGLREILQDPLVRLIHKPYSISEFTEAVRDVLEAGA